MISKLFESTDFVQTVELWPPGYSLEGPAQPLDRQFSWLAERVEILGEYFDAFHVADLKRPGRGYIDSVMTAVHLREKFPWIEVAPTLSARDRNKKALQESVATSLFFGIDNMILVWGDRFTEGEPGKSANVYDVVGVSGLIQLARGVQGRTKSGGLCILTPIDLGKVKDARYLAMIKAREKATSDVFLSQIFAGEAEDYLSLIDIVRSEGVKSPILHNVFPFYGHADALDISSRFGLPVSREILNQLKEGGAAAGVRIASRFRQELHDNHGKVNGVFISSRGEPELAIRLVQ